MKNQASIILLAVLGWFLIIGGIVTFILTGSILLEVIVVFSGIVLLIMSGFLIGNSRSEWKVLDSFEPTIRRQLLKKAKAFGEITKIQNVLYSKVTASHTKHVNVLGLNDSGSQVLVSVDPVTLEAVTFFLLSPRDEPEATEIQVSEQQAKSACMAFLIQKGCTIPDDFKLESARIVNLGPWKRWCFVWQHTENGVRIMPDFIRIVVNTNKEARVVSYSKVEHRVQVDLKPRLSLLQALRRVNELMQETQGLDIANCNLSVVYPNYLFINQVWEWCNKQSLAWILKFEQQKKHVMDVWVDANNGQMLGGYLCHLHAPELYGIDAPGKSHMQSHINNIWAPFFEMIKFENSASNYSNNTDGFAEGTVANSIANGKFFIVEGHGDITVATEKMIITYQGTDESLAFTPDEVPANNLRFVLLDTCHSGHDGFGQDFKDAFINHGADVFIGFDEYMCAWNYEQSLVHYLAQGMHLVNAHGLAEAETNPWYPIVINYNAGCLNRVRLAPLLVIVTKSPTGLVSTGEIIQVEALINNREDIDHTPAINTQASLVLPAGFSIISGTNPQYLNEIDWNSPKAASWIIRAPDMPGTYHLDVEICSDNLGVAVDDPSEPFHKFEVEVVNKLWRYVIYSVELFVMYLLSHNPQRKIGVEGRVLKKLR